LLLLLLVVAMVTLPPAALASSPDPTWIAGLYDDADDTVQAVMATVASLDVPPTHGRRLPVVAFVRLRATLTLSPTHTRAPPMFSPASVGPCRGARRG
jgi:hypothetical protein